MKNVLITGAGSYVGEWVKAHLLQWQERYQVQTLDMIGDGYPFHVQYQWKDE